MEEYKTDDLITPLTCDEKHYFHTACLESWIKMGKNSCPLCRLPINEDVLNRSRGSQDNDGGPAEGYGGV